MFDLFSALEQQQELMTPKEVAKLLRVSHRSVQRMVAGSELPSMLVGGQRRFCPAQLHRHFAKKNPQAARERAKA